MKNFVKVMSLTFALFGSIANLKGVTLEQICRQAARISSYDKDYANMAFSAIAIIQELPVYAKKIASYSCVEDIPEQLLYIAFSCAHAGTLVYEKFLQYYQQNELLRKKIGAEGLVFWRDKIGFLSEDLLAKTKPEMMRRYELGWKKLSLPTKFLTNVSYVARDVFAFGYFTLMSGKALLSKCLPG
jgi:hypothetical protein